MILASGYSDKANLAAGEGFALIRKPYSPKILIDAINEAFAGRSLDKQAG